MKRSIKNSNFSNSGCRSRAFKKISVFHFFKQKRFIRIFTAAVLCIIAAAIIIFAVNIIFTDEHDRSSQPIIYSKDSQLYAKTALSDAEPVGQAASLSAELDNGKLISFIDKFDNSLVILRDGKYKTQVCNNASGNSVFSPNGKYMLYTDNSDNLILYDVNAKVERTKISGISNDLFGFGNNNKYFYYIEQTSRGSSLFVQDTKGNSMKIDTGADNVLALTDENKIFYTKGSSLHMSNIKKNKTAQIASGDIECFFGENSDILFYTNNGSLYYVSDSGENTLIDRSVTSIIYADPSSKSVIYTSADTDNPQLYNIYLSKNNNTRYFICKTDSLDDLPIDYSNDAEIIVYRDIATRELFYKDFSEALSEPKRLDENVYTIELSDDGKYLTYTAENSSGNYDLMMFSSGYQILASNNASVSKFHISPDNTMLYFISDLSDAGVGTLNCVSLKISSSGLNLKQIDSDVIEFYPRGGGQVLYERNIDSKNNIIELKLHMPAKNQSVDTGKIKILTQ